MRDEFEKWYLGKFCGGEARLFRCVNADEVYYFPQVQSKWDAWQASRAAIVVKLPETPNRGVGYGLFDAGKERCADAIREAGLRVEE